MGSILLILCFSIIYILLFLLFPVSQNSFGPSVVIGRRPYTCDGSINGKIVLDRFIYSRAFHYITNTLGLHLHIQWLCEHVLTPFPAFLPAVLRPRPKKLLYHLTE